MKAFLLRRLCEDDDGKTAEPIILFITLMKCPLLLGCHSKVFSNEFEDVSNFCMALPNLSFQNLNQTSCQVFRIYHVHELHSFQDRRMKLCMYVVRVHYTNSNLKCSFLWWFKTREQACILPQLENEKGRAAAAKSISFSERKFFLISLPFFQKLINMQNSSFAQHRLSTSDEEAVGGRRVLSLSEYLESCILKIVSWRQNQGGHNE